MTLRASWAVGPLLMGLLVATTGCGSGTAEVSGAVHYQGKKVRTGTVMVFDAAGKSYPGDITPDGTYTVSGVPSGAVQLSVQSPAPPSDRVLKYVEKLKEKQNIPSAAPPRPRVNRKDWFALPAAYSTPASSGLSTTLQPGPNSFDLDLK